jgi:hypothetical protein
MLMSLLGRGRRQGPGAVEDIGGLGDLVVVRGDADSGDGHARSVRQVDQFFTAGDV